MVEPAIKLGVPKIFDLYNPKREYPSTLTPNAWVGGIMMKIVSDFEKKPGDVFTHKTRYT